MRAISRTWLGKTGQYVIASCEHGHREILFTPPSRKEAEFLLPELVESYRAADSTEDGHPIILLGTSPGMDPRAAWAGQQVGPTRMR